MYLYKPSAYLSLLNKYKDTLIIKRYSNTTIVGVGDESEELTSKNNLATLVTSQFIAKNIQMLYDTVNDLQNHKTEEFKILDIDITKLKKLPPYIWYDLNIHEISDCFKGCKPNMVLVWLDGMDLPSVAEFLKKAKGNHRLQLITRVYNDRYIRYGVEYEDDNVICTFTRPNVVLYPNTKI